jgi:hypothetical protein
MGLESAMRFYYRADENEPLEKMTNQHLCNMLLWLNTLEKNRDEVDRTDLQTYLSDIDRIFTLYDITPILVSSEEIKHFLELLFVGLPFDVELRWYTPEDKLFEMGERGPNVFCGLDGTYYIYKENQKEYVVYYPLRETGSGDEPLEEPNV